MEKKGIFRNTYTLFKDIILNLDLAQHYVFYILRKLNSFHYEYNTYYVVNFNKYNFIKNIINVI